MSILFLQFLLAIVFLTVVFLHVAKKNLGAIVAYSIQSFAIVMILFNAFLETGALSLLFIALLALLVKVILASIFFVRLVRKHASRFSVSTYLSTPLTLIVIAVLTAIVNLQKFSLLTGISPTYQTLLSLALGAMFLSIFLIINCKGALSQIIGVLSLENSILAFVIFAGLEQSFGLQIGIMFDIFVWLVIATIFVSMIHKHFGSLNVTSMQRLQD